jgi:cytosine/adenosine deaminase-related metal-dependent hydrolase
MMTSGVRVGLGLDGKGINDDDDFLQEMKVCYLLHRVPSLELDSAHMGSRDVMKMATEEGSMIVGYQNELGRLESGKRADMVLLDFQEMCWPYVNQSHDPVDILLYRGHKKYIHTVIVEGRVVVQEGEVLTVDERAIGNRLAEAANRPMTNAEKDRQDAFDEIRTCTADYYRGWSKKVRMEPYFFVNSKIDS